MLLAPLIPSILVLDDDRGVRQVQIQHVLWFIATISAAYFFRVLSGRDLENLLGIFILRILTGVQYVVDVSGLILAMIW